MRQPLTPRQPSTSSRQARAPRSPWQTSATGWWQPSPPTAKRPHVHPLHGPCRQQVAEAAPSGGPAGCGERGRVRWQRRGFPRGGSVGWLRSAGRSVSAGPGQEREPSERPRSTPFATRSFVSTGVASAAPRTTSSRSAAVASGPDSTASVALAEPSASRRDTAAAGATGSTAHGSPRARLRRPHVRSRVPRGSAAFVGIPGGFRSTPAGQLARPATGFRQRRREGSG